MHTPTKKSSLTKKPSHDEECCDTPTRRPEPESLLSGVSLDEKTAEWVVIEMTLGRGRVSGAAPRDATQVRTRVRQTLRLSVRIHPGRVKWVN